MNSSYLFTFLVSMRESSMVVEIVGTFKPLRTKIAAVFAVILLDVKKAIGFGLENIAAECTLELGMTKK